MRNIRWPLVAIAVLLAVHALPASGQNVPLFRFYAFSGEDLEIGPGASMALHGPIHANGDLYLNCETATLLSIGERFPDLPVPRVTAGGRIHRGRKNNTSCGGTVQIDALRYSSPLGGADTLSVPCGASGARITLPPQFIAQFWGSVADASPFAQLPPHDIIARGDAYWQLADLRVVLDLAHPGSNGLVPIVVQTAEGVTDPSRTALLYTFMQAQPGRVFYNDVPLIGRDATGTCGASPTTNTYCHPASYMLPFANAASVYPCARGDLFSAGTGCSTYVANRAIPEGGLTARRGGFYDNREHEWVYMLNVNVHDLLAWNRAQPPESRLFDPDDATHGGVVLYLGVDGASGDITSPRRAVRVFGSPNLDFPTVADPTGLTVVSDGAVYVEGSYNDGSGTCSHASCPKMPAALIGDTVNVLSNGWSGKTACRNDCQSRQTLSSRPAASTTLNAAVLGGISRTVGSIFGGGHENFLRMHETWSGTVLTYRGSFVSLGPPSRANGAWCGTGGSLTSGCNIYNPAMRDWDFDPTLLYDSWLPPATPRITPCGDGVVDDGESCDDGNTASGDCCSSMCQLEPAGSICRAVADDCDAAEVCDGTSTICPADVSRDDGVACEDGDPCTADDVCAAGSCTSGATCDDGNPCTGDVCTESGCEYPATPATTCHTAATSTFALSQRNGVSSTLRWKWMRGTSTLADFGTPTTSTGYVLCLYDADGLVLRGAVPPSSSLWRAASAKLWRYTDHTASAAGVSKLDLAGSDSDRSRIALTAVGDALPDPDLSAGLALPVTLQLRRDDDPACWTSEFGASSAKKNDASRFDARVQ